MEKYCFGVDVGGTTVKQGLFRTDGELLEKWEIPTRLENGGQRILPDTAASLLAKIREREIDRDRIVGVGIGVPGPVDAGGMIYRAVNLGWGTFSVKEEFCSLLEGIPVEAGNDANVAALGEMWRGSARGYRNVILLTLGTGVGGGVILDGKILPGSVGAAGELGHMHVNDEETVPCNCGNCGCLEQYASATGVVRMARQMLEQGGQSGALSGQDFSCRDVWDAAKRGDSLALKVAEKFGWYLGKALSCAACVVDPEIVVLGGGVSKAGDFLLDFVRKYFVKYAMEPYKNVRLVCATLGNDAGICGAAKLVLG